MEVHTHLNRSTRTCRVCSIYVCVCVCICTEDMQCQCVVCVCVRVHGPIYACLLVAHKICSQSEHVRKCVLVCVCVCARVCACVCLSADKIKKEQSQVQKVISLSPTCQHTQHTLHMPYLGSVEEQHG